MFDVFDFLLNVWPLILFKKNYVITIYFDVACFSIEYI